jgi:RNA polymerase sigma-70 factor (ECF subfamily)
MAESPPTRASLLVRIRDAGDADAWRQFVQIYSSLIYGFARKRGLQDADAADLMQDVLRSVAGAVGRLNYDTRKGTFRGWLYTVTRNKLNNFLVGRQRQVRGTGDSNAQELLEEQAVENDGDAALWDQEYERRLFDWAAEQVRGEFQDATWQAFWETAVEDRSAAEVGKTLGMSVGSIYVAKSRVLARLKETIRQLQVD